MTEENLKQTVYIALGTNMGDRQANLEEAIVRMQPAVKVLACSPVYETPPWGYAEQPDFLNQVIRGETSLQPMDLLDLLKRIEVEMGRVKIIHNGPRLIDLDLLFYGDVILESERLTIPHPRMLGRGFVLLPLADLAPDLIHPLLGISIRELLKDADCSGITRFADGSCQNTD
jgi:2-amino-4-hydroxy-6-hydroxymethyldihydropteridine diphosphokinase